MLFLLLKLTMNNGFKIYEDYCVGLNSISKQQKTITLSIYTIEKVIPNLLLVYRDNINWRLWLK